MASSDVKNKDSTSEAEDLPSDFFDDFSKAEFIEGLSVIDSWDVEDGIKRPRGYEAISAETLDKVRDLREVIDDSRDEKRFRRDRERNNENKVKGEGTTAERSKRSTSRDLDRYIKPGSRRNLDKTNEAIKRDKEVKVKEFLAKTLEFSDDLRPPGTELDDFCDEGKLNKKPPAEIEVKKESDATTSLRNTSRRHRDSPRRHSPKRWRPSGRQFSPRRSPLSKRSPFLKRSPGFRRSPGFGKGPNSRRSPVSKRSPPSRHHPSSRHSPSSRHRSPQARRSPLRYRSRSPVRRSSRDRKLSTSRHSPNSQSASTRPDNFLYPKDTNNTSDFYSASYGNYTPSWDPIQLGYPGYNYPAAPPMYPAGYTGSYGQPPGPVMAPQAAVPFAAPPLAPVPQPVPAPVPKPAATHGTAPPMVPPPMHPPAGPTSLIHQPTNTSITKTKPYDALAQLVAEGKISKEDYLKLAPSKSVVAEIASIPSPSAMKEKIELLSRCHTAINKLNSLHLPNRVVIHQQKIGSEPKYITPKFCSPLKRNPLVEFTFTQPKSATLDQQNKQLIDSILATIGIEKDMVKPKKKQPQNMRDAAVQTTKAYCDVCEIRRSTNVSQMGTSTDPQYFSSSVHTQVLQEDLLNSKTLFNPSGSIADGAPISIAHLTPAQLVSQLAAKAKTLKQSDHPQDGYMRRPPANNYYDYDRGGNSYHNNYNYRY